MSTEFNYKKNPDKSSGSSGSFRGCLFFVVFFLLGVIGTYQLFLYWASISIPTYFIRNSFNPWGMRIEKIDYAFTDQGGVCWIHSYYSGGGKGSAYHTYELDIIEPNTKKLIRKIQFDQTTSITAGNDISDFQVLDYNRYFTFNALLGIHTWDAYNGDILEDEKDIFNGFPELGAGIAEIKKENSHFLIITKDGLKFWFYPGDRKIITPEIQKQRIDLFNQQDLDSNSKECVRKFVWGLEGEIRKQLYLVRKFTSIYEPDFYPENLNNLKKKLQERKEKNSIQTETNGKLNPYQIEARHRNEQYLLKEQKLVCVLENKIFLEPKIIYQDQEYCIVLHNTEAGGKGKNKLTCINQACKVIWELEDIPGKVLNKSPYSDDNDHFVPSQISTKRKENQLAIINNNYYHRMIGMFDIKTGELIWEYDPFE